MAQSDQQKIVKLCPAQQSINGRKDQDMSDQESNLLILSTKKQKEERPMIKNPKVSFFEKLFPKIEDPGVNIVTHCLENISFQEKLDNPLSHPNFIPITTNKKHRLYTHWKHALIIKLVGKRWDT